MKYQVSSDPKPFKTRKEIAEELSISVSTLNRYLKESDIELPKGRYLKPSEYCKVYKLFE
ncbi:winged helix-turn-helix transcriptional regulator [Roseivirga seohaensis]|uniref:winged helix-turn-helix transcriptional regulator n=1 Tax=Roseivirga seohaensis TaxID=1914963 RepID=UPI003BAB60FD